ncbi:MAG: hypothetical protein WAZ19_15035 [Anaerolineae bacterium]
MLQRSKKLTRQHFSLLVQAIFLASLSWLLLLVPYQFQPTDRTLLIGSEPVTTRLTGFSFVETDGQRAYRWSEADASIRFDNVANQPMQLVIIMHAARPNAAPHMVLSVNGVELQRLQPGGNFAEYRFVIPRSLIGWQGRATISFQVDPFNAPPDTRQLGAAIASIQLLSLGGPIVPPWPVTWPLLLATVVFVILATRLHLRIATRVFIVLVVALGYALAALRFPETLGSNARWLPILAGAGLVLAVALPPLPRLLRTIWHRLAQLRTTHPTTFWGTVIVAAFLAIALPLATTSGYWGDIEIYMAWTYQITHFGIHSAYSPPAIELPNTTPFLLYLFKPAGQLFQRFWSPDFPPTWQVRDHIPVLRFLLRIPALLATLSIALLLYRETRTDWGRRTALLVAAAYLFNPAVLFEAPYYGQTGAVHSLFMLASIIALVHRRPALSWASLMAGALTKPQADIFWPLVILLTWQRFGWRGMVRGSLAALLVALVILFPFLQHGTLDDMWTRVSRVTSYHPVLSATAHNFWWFISFGQGKASDLGTWPIFARLGWSLFTFRNIGLGLFGLAFLLVLVRVLRDNGKATLYEAAAYLFCAFFMLSTQIHENHLIPMYSLLLLAAVANRRLRWIYALLAVTSTVNMALHYPVLLHQFVPQNPDVWGGAELFLPRWINSAVQVAIFVYWTWLFGRTTWSVLRSTRPIRSTQMIQTTKTATLTKVAAS